MQIGDRVRVNEKIRWTNGMTGTVIAIEELPYPDRVVQMCRVSFDEPVPIGMGATMISAMFPEDELEQAEK